VDQQPNCPHNSSKHAAGDAFVHIALFRHTQRCVFDPNATSACSSDVVAEHAKCYRDHQNTKSTRSRQQEQQQRQQQQQVAATAEGVCPFTPRRRPRALSETPPAHTPRRVPSSSREEERQEKKRHFRVGRRVDVCCGLHGQKWQSARVVALDHSTVRIQWASPSGIHAESFAINDPRVRPKRVRFSLDLPASPTDVLWQCIQQGGNAHKVGHRQPPRKDFC